MGVGGEGGGEKEDDWMKGWNAEKVPRGERWKTVWCITRVIRETVERDLGGKRGRERDRGKEIQRQRVREKKSREWKSKWTPTHI